MRGALLVPVPASLVLALLLPFWAAGCNTTARIWIDLTEQIPPEVQSGGAYLPAADFSEGTSLFFPDRYGQELALGSVPADAIQGGSIDLALSMFFSGETPLPGGHMDILFWLKSPDQSQEALLGSVYWNTDEPALLAEESFPLTQNALSLLRGGTVRIVIEVRPRFSLARPSEIRYRIEGLSARLSVRL